MDYRLYAILSILEAEKIDFIQVKETSIDTLRKSVNEELTFVDQANSNFPAIANVRNGTSYASGLYTGTLKVPTAAQVLAGIPVDATTGTLLMTPADFWNYLISSGFTAGSLGERLQNASTVATTGAQIASYNI